MKRRAEHGAEKEEAGKREADKRWKAREEAEAKAREEEKCKMCQSYSHTAKLVFECEGVGSET